MFDSQYKCIIGPVVRCSSDDPGASESWRIGLELQIQRWHVKHYYANTIIASNTRVRFLLGKERNLQDNSHVVLSLVLKATEKRGPQLLLDC